MKSEENDALFEDDDAVVTVDTFDYDEEEGRDRVAAISTIPPTNFLGNSRRSKQVSDMTGFATFTGAGFDMTGSMAKPHRWRSKSDAALMIALPSEAVERRHMYDARSIKSRDILVKNAYVPALQYDDLQLAEVVHELGSRRKRVSSGISDVMVHEKLETIIESVAEFELNDEGLTSEEASIRLKLHGLNELPEKVDPKWLVFLRQFWAPMPLMIWAAIVVEIAINNFIDMGECIISELLI